MCPYDKVGIYLGSCTYFLIEQNCYPFFRFLCFLLGIPRGSRLQHGVSASLCVNHERQTVVEVEVAPAYYGVHKVCTLQYWGPARCDSKVPKSL